MVGNNYTKKRHTMLREFLVEMKGKAEGMFLHDEKPDSPE